MKHESAEQRGPVDLLIVGGGPTGLFGAFYAGLRHMSVAILDSLPELGGQLVTLYPEKYIYDVPGFPKVLARRLAELLIEQAMQYAPAVYLGQQVQQLRFDEARQIYTVVTAQGDHPARAILIAAGIGAFAPKKLPIENAERFEGRGLSYSVARMEDFRDKRVVIVGGGDSAVDWANALAPLAKELTLVHRREQFRAHEDSCAQLRRSSARLKLCYEVKEIRGNGQIEEVLIYDNRSNEEQTLSADAVLVNIGFESALGPIKDWSLELAGGQIRVDSTMRTSRPGIFAAGDIATYPGKLKLIATGFGEAATAVNYAKNYLDPKANVFPGHSSNLKK